VENNETFQSTKRGTKFKAEREKQDIREAGKVQKKEKIGCYPF
jgi:hypothetical protein